MSRPAKLPSSGSASTCTPASWPDTCGSLEPTLPIGSNVTKRLQVLIVSPTFPYPPSWGFGMRVYQLARYLSEHHDVTLLSYARADEMVHVELASRASGRRARRAAPAERGLTKRLDPADVDRSRGLPGARPPHRRDADGDRRAAVKSAVRHHSSGIQPAVRIPLPVQGRPRSRRAQHRVRAVAAHATRRAVLDPSPVQPGRVPEVSSDRTGVLAEGRWVRRDFRTSCPCYMLPGRAIISTLNNCQRLISLLFPVVHVAKS